MTTGNDIVMVNELPLPKVEVAFIPPVSLAGGQAEAAALLLW